MVFENFNLLIQGLLSLIQSLGYIGIFVGMTIESSFFPFPSELILLPAGALIAQGKMSFLAVFVAGILGSVAGAWINYFLALFLGRKAFEALIEKYGQFFLLDKEKLEKTDNYFEKHGEITTFLGRLVFVVRQLISLPAGFSKMNFSRFTLFTALGAGIWTAILILLGMFFGSTASTHLKWITGILLIISAITSILYYNKKKK